MGINLQQAAQELKSSLDPEEKWNHYQDWIDDITAKAQALLKALDETLTEEKFLEIITEWKHVWMNQKQNDEADYQNYHRRAFGIDANMKYSLARRLVKYFNPTKEIL